MTKFDLDKWARIGEVATAVVVVVSLVYIAIQLDQSNRATHAASWEAVNEMLINLDVAEATELGIMIKNAEYDPNKVSPEEYWQFSRMAQARLGIIEYAFLGIETGTLSRYHWGALSGYLGHTICKPGYRRFWAELGKAVYHVDFQQHVDGIISKCINEPPDA